MGEYAKAEGLYQQALSINTKALGEGHPAVARTLRNLGSLYSSMHEIAKAESFNSRAAEIDRRSRDAHPPSSSANYVTDFLTQSGKDYTLADPVYRQSQQVPKKSRREVRDGADH